MMGLKIALFCSCLALVACRTITVQKTSLSLTEKSEDADALNDILWTFLASSDVTSDEQDGGIIQVCSKGKCEFCKKILSLKVCFVATLEKDSIVLEVTLNKKPILKTVITGANPPKVCKKSIPYFKFVTDVCVQVKDVNLQQASGCVYVSFKIKGKQFSKKIGCFKIPTSDGLNQVTEAESVETEDQDVGAAMLDGAVLKFETMNTNS